MSSFYFVCLALSLCLIHGFAVALGGLIFLSSLFLFTMALLPVLPYLLLQGSNYYRVLCPVCVQLLDYIMKMTNGLSALLRLQVRTTADALKLIPFSLLIIVPLGELLIPVALRLFPNMLPSTFKQQ